MKRIRLPMGATLVFKKWTNDHGFCIGMLFIVDPVDSDYALQFNLGWVHVVAIVMTRLTL